MKITGRIKRNTSLVVSVGLVGIFILVVLSLAFSHGVSCGDDAFFASVAKNLANGTGYASSMQYSSDHYRVIPHDPMITTGPTLVVPAALLIKVLGNRYWVPGLTQCVVCLCLLVALVWLLQVIARSSALSLFTACFLFLCYALMTYHLEQWYALLGEVPAALLLLLAFLLSFRSSTKMSSLYLGVVFGLAMQTKLLALLGFVGYCLFLSAEFLATVERPFFLSLRSWLWRQAPLGLGFLMPFVMIEIWRLIDLGGGGYLLYWSGYSHWIGSFGVNAGPSTSVMIRALERVPLLTERFCIYLPCLPALFYLARVLIDDARLKRLFDMLCVSIIIFSGYWILISVDWPRYFIIALVLCVFTLCLPLLKTASSVRSICYATMLVLLSSGAWLRLEYPFERVEHWFQPDANTKAQLAAVEFLNQLGSEGGAPFATEWWATASDLEYLLPGSLNFSPLTDPVFQTRDTYWLVCNTKFLSSDPEIRETFSHALELQEFGVIKLARLTGRKVLPAASD